MRRLSALLAAVAVLLSLAAVPAEAAAYLRLRAVRVLSPGAVTKIEVEADSGIDITGVRAVVRPYPGGTAPSITADDFELVEGTAANGVWRTKSDVTVPQGRWWVEPELTNAEQTLRYQQRATIDNGLDTVITDFEVSPTTVDVDNTRVAFQARLMSRAADGTLTPVEGAPVRLNGPDGASARAVTAADGRLAGTTGITASGEVTLSYAGSFTYRPARSAVERVAKRRLKTRLTFAMPGRLIVGDKVNVTGRLERQGRDGVWAPLAGKRLDLRFNPSTSPEWTTLATPTTDAGGDYSVPVTITANGAWTVMFANDPVNLPDDYGNYESSSAGTDVREVAYRTSIVGFNANPEPVGKGDMVTATGTVMNKLADGRNVPAAANATVRLQFSADGKAWSNKAEVLVSLDGTFGFEGRADRDGYWRAVVPEGDYALPSTSGTDYVDVRYRTRILDFSAMPEPVKKGGTVTVVGTLYRETTKWQPYASKTISFYFRPKGSSTWTYLGKMTADKLGRFRKGFKATKDGTWRAHSAATSTYVMTYRDDYVDVR